MKYTRILHIFGFALIFFTLAFSLQSLESVNNKINNINYSSRSTDVDLNNISIISTLQNGTYISYNNEKDFKKITDRIFFDENDSNIPIIKLISISNNEFIFVTKNKGLIYTNDGCQTFKKINNGLPKKRIVINGKISDNLYRDITAFAIDTENKNNMFLTTKYGIYRTKNRGLTWENYIRPSKQFNNLTAIAFSSKYGFHLYLGTAYNGLYYQEKENGVWQRLNTGLKMNGGIVEEIGSLAIDPQKSDFIYCGHSFGNRLYKINRKTLIYQKDQNNRIINYSPKSAVFKQIQIPFDEMIGSVEVLNDIKEIKIAYKNNTRIINLSTSKGIVEKDDSNHEWNKIDINNILNDFLYKNDIQSYAKFINGNMIYSFNNINHLLTKNDNKNKSRFYEKARGKRGYYMQTHVAMQKNRLENLIDNLKRNGYNMVTIDLKDDFGHVNYNSKLDIVKKVGSNAGTKINLKSFLETMHNNGIYVVARVVVFKDPVLFEYENNKYTILDSTTNKAWKGYLIGSNNRQIPIKERWLDPFSSFVWEYNISIAQELESLGVDEIQFDYIRFPTDGDNLSDIHYRYREPEQERKDALESFLLLARQRLNIPISVDIYGSNGWNRMGDRIGQDIEMLSNYVDAIAPMFYPSHFHPAFSNFPPYKEKPYRIYYYGTLRSLMMTCYRVEIRSYLQAFKINYNPYDKEYYGTDYVAYQIIGVNDADSGAGYTWWNSATRYNIVNKAHDRVKSLKHNTGIRRVMPQS